MYRRGGPHSWDQDEPTVALRLLASAAVGSAASVVDVGGGDGALAAALIRCGHTDLTVVDVSDHGLAAGRRRVGPAADQVRWVRADVRLWRPERTYDVWHDRAVFHFLLDPVDRAGYGAALRLATGPGSFALLATFALEGPRQCSGLPVARYDPERLLDTVRAASGVDWTLEFSAAEEHATPAGPVQPFSWAVLRRPS